MKEEFAERPVVFLSQRCFTGEPHRGRRSSSSRPGPTGRLAAVSPPSPERLTAGTHRAERRADQRNQVAHRHDQRQRHRERNAENGEHDERPPVGHQGNQDVAAIGRRPASRSAREGRSGATSPPGTAVLFICARHAGGHPRCPSPGCQDHPRRAGSEGHRARSSARRRPG